MPVVEGSDNMRDVIGTTVSGSMDRNILSRHSRYPDMIYPVKYGFVGGAVANGGEAQYAYVLGANEPIESFEGMVIAVYHRIDDMEGKWVLCLAAPTTLTRRYCRRFAFMSGTLKGSSYVAQRPTRLPDGCRWARACL